MMLVVLVGWGGFLCLICRVLARHIVVKPDIYRVDLLDRQCFHSDSVPQSSACDKAECLVVDSLQL